MARRPNYGAEKRHKQIQKQQKKEEKLEKKRLKKEAAANGEIVEGDDEFEGEDELGGEDEGDEDTPA